MEGVEAVVRRVPETLSPEILEKMGATQAQKEQAEIPVCTVDELTGARYHGKHLADIALKLTK